MEHTIHGEAYTTWEFTNDISHGTILNFSKCVYCFLVHHDKRLKPKKYNNK